MSVGIEGDFATENMMRLLRNSMLAVVVLAAIAVALAPETVLADDGVRIKGTFTVSFMYPSALSYCGPSGGDLSIEAQGIGNISGLGPLFLTVKKCLKFADGTYAGTFEMTAGNGDSLKGNYAGTQDFSLSDENGYGPFQGTLTVTGGTGRFRRARGGLSFTAVASPTSMGVKPGTENGTAFYLVRGDMLTRRKN